MEQPLGQHRLWRCAGPTCPAQIHPSPVNLDGLPAACPSANLACKEKKPCRTSSHACLALPTLAGRHFCSWPNLHSACNVHHLLSCFSPALHTLILQGGAGAPSQPPSAGGVAAELLPATARGKLGTAVQNLPATCCPGCTMLLCTKLKGKSARRPVTYGLTWHS